VTTTKKRGREGELLKGKYRLERLLGVGGMGEVYRAVNVAAHRKVAIKLLRTEVLSNQDIVKRFMREARAANSVPHPNIVEVIDIDTDEHGTPFIVQELLEGETLSTRLKRSGDGLPAPQAIDFLLPVIRAIGAAHAKRVVHRDIKPSNIFLAHGERGINTKILDFGISRTLDEGDIRLTTTGATMGSPAYMSPEQIRDARVADSRSDVWSIGVVLYEALSGRMPFFAESQSGLMVKICTSDPIPLHEAAPGVPSAVARVIDRCLRRPPDERYADAVELARELEFAFRSEPDLPKANPFLKAGDGTGPNGASPWATSTARETPLELVEPARPPKRRREEPGIPADDLPNMAPAYFGFMIILFGLMLNIYFAPSALTGTIAQWGVLIWPVLVGCAALALYFGFAIQRYQHDLSLSGLRIATWGTFGLGASLLIAMLSLAGSDSAMDTINSIALPLSASLSAFGLGGAGLQAARQGLLVGRSYTARVTMFLLSAAALIVGLQYVIRFAWL